MVVTQADIAKALNISQGSVSHVLNGREDRLRPETVERIRRALREANYATNQAASSLRRGRSSLIGMLMPNLRHPLFIKILETFHKLAREAGLSVITFDAEDSVEQEQRFIREAISYRVEGLVVVGSFSPPRRDVKHLQQFVKNGPAIVTIGGSGKLKYPAVTVDMARGMEAVIEHLFELGHQRIAYAAYGRDHWSGQHRWKGIQAAYRRAGHHVPGDEDFYPPFAGMSLHPHEGGIEATEAILRERDSQPYGRKYTAIVGMNDNVALGAIRCLIDHGLKVPEDISVVGFDDLDVAAVSVPRLTTVNQPKEEMAEAAFEMLMKQIENGEMLKSRELKTELIVRDSTARAAAKLPTRPAGVVGLAEEKGKPAASTIAR